MKKIITVLLGAVMALGTVSFSFAGGSGGEQQDQGGGQTQDGVNAGRKGGKGKRGKGKHGKGKHKRNRDGGTQTPTAPAPAPQPYVEPVQNYPIFDPGPPITGKYFA